MATVLSENTKAILLLTAPLIVGRGGHSRELLKPREYQQLAAHLQALGKQPADLLTGDTDLRRACSAIVDEARLARLLDRGFLLTQAIEQWHKRALWIVSRADADYPRRLKMRLRERAPAVLYGCGDKALLDRGGLAVIGSRHVDESLTRYTLDIGALAAQAGRAVVSGGARGIDQAAMHGALEHGGRVVGVLANNLERTAMQRDQRNWLHEQRLVLVSPFDPRAGFNAGNAMQRNKLIYAFADAALVVNSDLEKGGTWAGAVEQLERYRHVPVYVRGKGAQPPAFAALRDKGARVWPEPEAAEDLAALACVKPCGSC
jgi:predicted Rossmann fold nucleotide-binding protein DprA/Smf involved in DNA uptake